MIQGTTGSRPSRLASRPPIVRPINVIASSAFRVAPTSRTWVGAGPQGLRHLPVYLAGAAGTRSRRKKLVASGIGPALGGEVESAVGNTMRRKRGFWPRCMSTPRTTAAVRTSCRCRIFSSYQWEWMAQVPDLPRLLPQPRPDPATTTTCADVLKANRLAVPGTNRRWMFEVQPAQRAARTAASDLSRREPWSMIHRDPVATLQSLLDDAAGLMVKSRPEKGPGHRRTRCLLDRPDRADAPCLSAGTANLGAGPTSWVELRFKRHRDRTTWKAADPGLRTSRPCESTPEWPRANLEGVHGPHTPRGKDGRVVLRPTRVTSVSTPASSANDSRSNTDTVGIAFRESEGRGVMTQPLNAPDRPRG